MRAGWSGGGPFGVFNELLHENDVGVRADDEADPDLALGPRSTAGRPRGAGGRNGRRGGSGRPDAFLRGDPTLASAQAVSAMEAEADAAAKPRPRVCWQAMSARAARALRPSSSWAARLHLTISFRAQSFPVPRSTHLKTVANEPARRGALSWRRTSCLRQWR
jgi:hypothetical protein